MNTIAIGGGHNPNIDAPRPFLPDALELPFLNSPKKLAL
jgi:hypothetical protein